MLVVVGLVVEVVGGVVGEVAVEDLVDDGFDVDGLVWWWCCEAALCGGFGACEGEYGAGLAGDDPVLVMDDAVVPGTNADQIYDVGFSVFARSPFDDVVDVKVFAGVAAREAACLVSLENGASLCCGRGASVPALVEGVSFGGVVEVDAVGFAFVSVGGC